MSILAGQDRHVRGRDKRGFEVMGSELTLARLT